MQNTMVALEKNEDLEEKNEKGEKNGGKFHKKEGKTLKMHHFGL